jgi:transposase
VAGSKLCLNDVGPMVVAIAVANKLVQIIWAMMTTGEFYWPKLAA